MCFQEEVQNSFRGHGTSHRPAGGRAETSHGQAERQGTGQGSCEKLLVFPENFPDMFTDLWSLHCSVRFLSVLLPDALQRTGRCGTWNVTEGPTSVQAQCEAVELGSAV